MSVELVRSRKFTTQQVERALLELSVCGGNSCAASRNLAADGLNVSDRMLRIWRVDTYPLLYRKLAEEQAPKIEQTITAQCRETAILAAEVERAALHKTAEQLEAGTIKDASTAARNAAVVKGVNLEKLLQLEGRPTQVTEVRKPQEIMATLQKLGVLRVIESDVKGKAAGEAVKAIDNSDAA